jgi:hypothetical protein
MAAAAMRCPPHAPRTSFNAFGIAGTLDIVRKACLVALLASAGTCATAATVKIVAEGPALANATMTETERTGATYLGHHLAGFVGDSLELDKGVHHILVDAPNNYIFAFSISVGDQNVTVKQGQCSAAPSRQDKLRQESAS